MLGGDSFFKKIFLTIVVIIIYIILSSSVVSVQLDKKVTSIFIDSLLNGKGPEFSTDYFDIVSREKELSQNTNNDLAKKLTGKILLQIEANGEAWYVYPVDLKRYYLGRPSDINILVEKLGLALSNEEIFNYLYFDKIFPKRLAGRLIFDKEDNAKIYYIDSESLLAHFMDGPSRAWHFMNDTGLGISNEDIRKISVGDYK